MSKVETKNEDGIIFSGIQPTGNLTLGNYLGAIKNWVVMQRHHKSLFCLVDLHAITMPVDPSVLKDNLLTNYALYLACGLDNKNSIIFKQSDARHHTELGWILGCNTQLGWLNRMTQFKDKAGKDKQKSNLGLYAYPTLQAADVLIYHANIVPVGGDQIQHLELVRDIAGAFNRRYGMDYFKLPEAKINESTSRIMSLRDGTVKMSKSDPSDMSRINLTDSADIISNKFKKAKADDINGIYYDAEKRPEISNLINIYAAIAGCTIEDVESEFKPSTNADFKRAISDVVIDALAPIQKEFKHYMNDTHELKKMLKAGGESAHSIASKTMDEVFEIIGFGY